MRTLAECAYHSDPMFHWAVDTIMDKLPATESKNVNRRLVIDSIWNNLPDDTKFTDNRAYHERVRRIKRVAEIVNGQSNRSILTLSKIGIIL